MDIEIFELFEDYNEVETEDILFDDSSDMQFELSEDEILTAVEFDSELSEAENIQDDSAPDTLGCCSNNSMKMKCMFCNGTGRGFGDFACNFCGGLGFK